METRTKNATRNIMFGLLYKFVTLLLPFVTRTLLLYLLGSGSTGISTLFSSILNFLSLAELGVGSAIVYAMYEPIAENRTDEIGALLAYFKKLYRYIGLAVLLIGGVLTPFLPYLIKGKAPDGVNIYILYCIYLTNSVISYFFAGYRQSLLAGYQRADIKDKIAMAVTVGVRLSEILVIAITRNLYLYAFVSIVGTVISNLITAIVTKKMYPQIKCRGAITSDRRRLIRKKLGGLFGTKLNSIVVNQADTLVISAFLGLDFVTRYGNYYFILSAVAGLVMVVFASMTAGIGNKIAVDGREKAYALFRKISFLNAWIVGWCSICLVCLYQPFMKIWVKEDLMLPFSTAILMAVYFFIYQIQRTVLTFKDAAGLWYEDRFRPYVSMVFNLVSNLVLVQWIGLNGVILSSILAFMISVPWCNRVVNKKLFQKKPIGNLLRMLGSLVGTALIAIPTYIVCGFCPDGIGGFVLKAAVCLILPNLCFFAVSFKRPEWKELLSYLRVLIGRRKEETK